MSDRAGSGTDRGSGSVLVLGLVGVLVILTLVVTAVGASVVARHRAEAAADLAALAAASAVTADGAPSVDCSRARRVVAAQGAVLTGCRALGDGSVVVEAVVAVPGLSRLLAGSSSPALPRVAAARARAGQPPPAPVAGTLELPSDASPDG